MSRRTQLIPVTLTLVGALALAGCGDDADSAGVTTSPMPTATGSPTESDSAVPDQDGRDGDPVFSAAISTAESSADGSRAVEYDLDEDDEKIDVTVVADDIEYELELSLDGARILSQEEDGTLTGDDLADVREATVSLTDAVATVLDREPGTVEEVELDREDGVLRWEVEIRTGSGTSEVHVDATTGEIVS